MNKILAQVKVIETLENLTVISFEANGQQLRLMALGLNFELYIGSEVYLGAKSSNISLAKNFHGELSISNQLQCSVTSIEMGTLLCSVTLRFADMTLRSVITKSSAMRMGLEVNDTIIALIKASDLSILEVKPKQGNS